MFASLTSLRRRAVTLVAGSALMLGALTASTAPAQASDDRLLRLLLGATAVAVIVHSANQAQSRARAPHAAPHAAPPNRLPQECRETLRVRGEHVAVYNARCLQNAGLRNLPQQCFETIRTNHGQRGVYRAGCLERRFTASAQPPRGHHSQPPRGHQPHRPQPVVILPQWCESRVHHRGNWHNVYGAQCLHRAGLQNLPGACRHHSPRGDVFAAQCLTRHGYRRH